MQTHENWLVLIRDDMSTDATIEKLTEACSKHDVLFWIEDAEGKIIDRIVYDDAKKRVERRDAKVVVVKNGDKFWEVKNVLAMINDEEVREDDIICRLDGDDFLCDLCALQDLNAVYATNKEAGCVWTAHRWADTLQNISAALPDGADPYVHPWVTSHMKTFRKSLITPVADENFRGPDGEYIKRAGDQAIYLPVLWRSLQDGYKNVFFPRLTYYYTIDIKPETFQTDDAKFQLREANFLRARGYVSNE